MGKQQDKKMITMACVSTGSRNNGLIEQCVFVEEFPDTGYKYLCPVCSGPMKKRKTRKRRLKKIDIELIPPGKGDGHI